MRSGTAFVLTGGGAKGSFQAGALRHLVVEQGLRPDVVCGVSVGALNGAKIAEAGPGASEQSAVRAAEQLVAVWESVATASEARNNSDHANVYEPDIVLDRWADQVVGQVDTWKAIWKGFTEALFPVRKSWLSGRTEGTPQNAVTKIGGLHAVSTFRGLRRIINAHVDVQSITQAGTKLRIGMTDAISGQFLTVTEPDPSAAPATRAFGTFGGRVGRNWRAGYGRIEIEGHQAGPAIVTLPAEISLAEAIYASSAMPVLMPPVEGYVVHDTLDSGGPWERLETQWPRDMELLVRQLIDADPDNPADAQAIRFWAGLRLPLHNRPEDATDEEERERRRAEHAAILESEIRRITSELRLVPPRRNRNPDYLLFDGGLVDISPIRSAIRLGVKDIYVVGASPWSSLPPWSVEGVVPYGENAPGGVTSLQAYLSRLVDCWSRKIASSDMMLAVAFNEFLGWTKRAYELLEPADQEKFRSDFHTYWQRDLSTGNEPRSQSPLGSHVWIGGSPFSAPAPPRLFREEIGRGRGRVVNTAFRLPIPTSMYGSPPLDSGCNIFVITPDEFIADSLDFSGPLIREGIVAGAAAAASPYPLSLHGT